MFRDTETGHFLNNGIRVAYVQLPEFDKTWEECENKFEQWIFLMKNMHRLEEFPETSLRDEVFARLEKVANYANLTREEQAVYEADLRWISEYDEEMATGRREAMAQGLAEGRAQGLEEGLAEGRAEGIIEGRAEGKAQGIAEEAMRIAHNLLASGMEEEFISKNTGLSLEEIEKLKNNSL